MQNKRKIQHSYPGIGVIFNVNCMCFFFHSSHSITNIGKNSMAVNIELNELVNVKKMLALSDHFAINNRTQF